MHALRSSASLALSSLLLLASGCSTSNSSGGPVSGTPIVNNHTESLYYLNQVTTNNVTTSSINTVAVTATGTPTPTTYTLPSTYTPVAAVVDASGNLYVGVENSADTQFSILIYAAGFTSLTTPTTTVSVPVIPVFLTADTSGDLFVATNGTNTVYKFTKSGTSYSQTSVTDNNLAYIGVAGVNCPAIAADSSGALHLLGTSASNNGVQVVDTFAATNTTGTPSSTFTLSSSSTKAALSITVDASANTYVVNENYPTISTITSDIAVYPAGTTGKPSAPARDILNPAFSTGFTEGTFFTAHVDSQGNLYSIFEEITSPSNSASGQYVFVGYSSTATGTATPTDQFILPTITSIYPAYDFGIY